MLMKKSRLFIVSGLSMMLGLGVVGGLLANKSVQPIKKVEASGTVSIEGKTFISLKQSSWTTANIKTAVYFWGDGDVNGWSDKYVEEYPLYDTTDSTHIVDVPLGTWTNYKCVRVNPAKCPSKPSGDCWGADVNWGESGNYTFGANNTLQPLIGGGYAYDTAWKFEAGQQVYLDLNGQGWTSDDAHINVHIWGNTAGGAITDLEMHNVHGWDNDNNHLYEFTVPGSGYWSNIIFYRSSASAGGKWYNQTADLSGDSSNNVFKLTSYTGGSWNWNMSNDDRAECYGTYFLEQITCSGSGSITSTSTNWTNVSNEYDALSETIQGIVWTSEAAESGTDLEEAMYRYDYIVLYKKYSGYNDFINRKDSPEKAFSGRYISFGILGNSENMNSLLIIVITSALAVSAVTGYFLLRRKKQK